MFEKRNHHEIHVAAEFLNLQNGIPLYFSPLVDSRCQKGNKQYVLQLRSASLCSACLSVKLLMQSKAVAS